MNRLLDATANLTLNERMDTEWTNARGGEIEDERQPSAGVGFGERFYYY